MSRRSCWLTVALLAVGMTVSAEAKPRKFSWEVSPYVATRSYDATSFDHVSSSPVGGVRLGFNLTRHWEIEGNLSFASADRDRRPLPLGPRRGIDIDTVDVNAVLNMNTGADRHEHHGRWISADRWVPYVTAGFGHLGETTDSGGGREAYQFNGGGGVRLMVSDIVGVRFDVRDYVAVGSRNFTNDYNNFESSIGMTFTVGGGVPRDSDSDGVIDGKDKCPGTPLGCWVDEYGCPRDSDGDGVCDGLDRCPNSQAGCPVDQNGCPIDTDGDGVCDGLDNCPGTPAGAWVDEHGCPKDSDNDGVLDGIDKCPDTPAGCKVDATGCTLDSDGDGVCDGKDQCPDTPRGVKVDEKGCPIQTVKLLVAKVNFEFNKADIQPFYRAILDEVAKSLLANDWRSVEIELRGHTDSIDTPEYNYRLGQARADSVKEYLVSHGVAPSRITTKSYSELQPIATNDTAEGRAMNRRVEMAPTTAVPADRMTEVHVLVRDVMFKAKSSELSDDGRKFLDDVAAAFAGDRLKDLRLKVMGSATGKGASVLAHDRATAVATYLGSKGVDASRIDITAEGTAADRVDVVPAGP